MMMKSEIKLAMVLESNAMGSSSTNEKRNFMDDGDFYGEDLEFGSPNPFDTNHPENNVTVMAESKDYVRKCRMLPRRYNAPLVSNAAMQLQKERQKLYTLERCLERSRRKNDCMRRNLINQWEDLERKEIELKNNFIEFNLFVKENSEKRARAHKKIDDERQLFKKRQQDAEDARNTLKEMIRCGEEMDANSRKYLQYWDFLRKVVEANRDQFKTVDNVVERFKSLLQTKDELSKSQKGNMAILEFAQVDGMKLIEEKNFVIMGLNNQIANLQARYENANIKSLESEGLVTEIKNNAVKQLSEIDTVKNSIWNVYVHMTLSKKHPIKIRKDNVEEQMMYINRTLTELSKVNKLIKKRSTKMK